MMWSLLLIAQQDARTREWVIVRERQNVRVSFFYNAGFTETVLAGDENKQRIQPAFTRICCI